MKKAYELLLKNKDEGYAEFQAKLTPGVPRDSFIGVRVPVVRAIAKEYAKDEESSAFLRELPHKYYDENMLHGLLISAEKDFDKAVAELDEFLPYVDNWSVCDIMSPKVLGKYKEKTLVKIKEWIASGRTYSVRFGIEMLMSFYLDKDFKPEYLGMVVPVVSEEYYVKMMLAWFFATALAKQWDSTVKVIEGKELDAWTHNKTIQKAIESYRITAEQKAYLRTLKR